MHLSPAAFKDAVTLFIVTGHELIHVGQLADGLPDSRMYMENAAWTFTSKAADMLGNTQLFDMANGLGDYYGNGLLQRYYQSDSRYSYTNYIPNIQFRDFVILH
jgi:hypothetical protein